jgi:putative polymerase
MSSALSTPGNAPAADGGRGATLGLALLWLAIGYNFPMALLNAHVMAIGRGTLIALETLLMGAGLLLALSQWRPAMTRWLLMITAFFALSLLLALPRGGFDPKSFRDMLMFAVFIMVGMTIPLPRLRRTLVVIQLVILTVMLVEVSFPDSYGAALNPRSYVMNTRGLTEDQTSLSGNTELFGAMRPDERYLLPQLGWNRASSIFLEPLSLGNYVAFAALAILLFWGDWRWRERLLMVVSTLVILVGCDGRFAAVSSLVLIVLAPLLVRLPTMLAIAWLPLGVLAARLASLALAWNPLEDTFTGRIARGMKHLFRMDWFDVLGGTVPTQALADSGISYLVMSQSLPGVIMMQLFLYLQPGLERREQRLVLHGTALTFTLSILVSISMLSIKTAGFYWFLVGSVLVLPQCAVARRPVGTGGQPSRPRGQAA